MASIPVLVVGAGPTGLVLALARRGVPFRLVSEATGPGEHSRAMGVQARTLELYRQFGFADDLVAAGIPARAVHLRVAGRERALVPLTDIGETTSPYPFMLTYPQDDHERFLLDRLAALGRAVEWRTALTALVRGPDGLHATLRHGDGRIEETVADHVAGCDGAHSTVRKTLGIPFDGGTYAQPFFVADVRIDGGFERDIFLNLGDRALVLVMPVRSRGVQRLIGLVPPELAARRDLGFEAVRPMVEALAGVRITHVEWFSEYRVHHRVAARFGVDGAFLLGDAAHVHSPVGGQGMNTGIGDAINLGWKLAAVVNGADPALLETYEAERIRFARRLVATTDRVFAPLVADGPSGRLLRKVVMPAAVALLTRLPLARRAAFATLSQTRIAYRQSPLGDGRARAIRGGDRLPWTGFDGPDNFAPLRSLDWQVHVHGVPDPAFESGCAGAGMPIVAFPWTASSGRAGYARHAAYLVRPDGYVALPQRRPDAGAIAAYLARWRIAGISVAPPPDAAT